MSRIADIVAFVRLAGDGLSPDVMARAIDRRWPDVSLCEMREVEARAGAGGLDDPAERAAISLAAAAILGRRTW